MNVREMMESREDMILSPFAKKSRDSRGRDREEEQCNIRTVFQRDRDRIIHCKAFRRLKHKTQVFLAPEGDHFRERMTHTLEVAQISRTIARSLSLNEDLTEAIALGHDLGHTPFGHAGERTLDTILQRYGSHFKHNEQSVRVVEFLENDGNGLNLTWEVRDGILNHGTKNMPQTLEGQVVRLADKIAYVNHDMDDAIRAGVLKEKDVPDDIRKQLGGSTHDRLDTLINQVIIGSWDKDVISMPEEYHKALYQLRSFMFDKIYTNSLVKAEEKKAGVMLKLLFDYYMNYPELLPKEYIEIRLRDNLSWEIVVADYISGMTDYYATHKFQDIYIPAGWK